MKKLGIIERTPNLTERKHADTMGAAVWVDVSGKLNISVPSQALGFVPFKADDPVIFTFPVYQKVAQKVKGTTTVIDESGRAGTITELRVRIIAPATASATGKFTIEGVDVTGGTAFALDSAAGTTILKVPTAALTVAAGDDVAFAVAGDTNGSLQAEVEVVLRAT